jgi:2-dehydro-3-deoxyphosphogluconate aldolase/(4S)-4-hydroxy-2-oxoglutarate aldolase
VITIDSAADAVPLARALAQGGARVLEVTLRTPAGIEAIRRIAGEVIDVIVGAGTITAPADLAACERAGAAFAVSPGTTDWLLDAAEDSAVPLLPGVMTISEAMRLLERGMRHMKLFPANLAGGPAFLAALHAPLPEPRFCPTGGVSRANLLDYLRLPNVICAGGSWLAPRETIARHDWSGITANAAEVARLAASLTVPA